MILDPLHPAVVHFPIVLAMLLPFVVLGALVLIHRGSDVRATWAVVFALCVALFASAFVAQRTGRADRRFVKDFVAEEPLKAHSAAANRLVLFSEIALALAALGFAPGAAGSAGRYATGAGGLVMMLAAWQVGFLGGELVYVHGAAGPHVETAGQDTDDGEDDASP